MVKLLRKIAEVKHVESAGQELKGHDRDRHPEYCAESTRGIHPAEHGDEEPDDEGDPFVQMLERMTFYASGRQPIEQSRG